VTGAQLRLWDDPQPIAAQPAPTRTRPRGPAIPRHIRRHRYDNSARPVTRAHGYYLTRKIRTLHPIGNYL
jgi:hypothetical protein